MSYKGTVRGTVIELDDGATLPEGMRVSITPQQPITGGPITLKEWLEGVRVVRAQLPESSDSVEILRHLREGGTAR
jgi:hypothetical protein